MTRGQTVSRIGSAPDFGIGFGAGMWIAGKPILQSVLVVPVAFLIQIATTYALSAMFRR